MVDLSFTKDVLAIGGPASVVLGIVAKFCHKLWKKANAIVDKIDHVANEIDRIHQRASISEATRRAGETRAVIEMSLTPNGDLVCDYVSREWTRLTGLTRETVGDGGWIRCVPVAEQQHVLALSEQAAEAQVMFQMEYTVIHVDSHKRRRVRYTGEPVFTHDRLAGWTGEIVDITEDTP